MYNAIEDNKQQNKDTTKNDLPNPGGNSLQPWDIKGDDKINRGKKRNLLNLHYRALRRNPQGLQAYHQLVVVLCSLKQTETILDQTFFAASNEQILYKLVLSLSITPDTRTQESKLKQWANFGFYFYYPIVKGNQIKFLIKIIITAVHNQNGL